MATVDDSLESDYKTFEGGYIASGNSDGQGGGIYSDGTLNVKNIVIIGNKSEKHGGGVFYGLCYTSIRRECGSRLFLVQEKFIRISLKSSRILGTIYVYQYAISEGLKIPGDVPI